MRGERTAFVPASVARAGSREPAFVQGLPRYVDPYPRPRECRHHPDPTRAQDVGDRRAVLQLGRLCPSERAGSGVHRRDPPPGPERVGRRRRVMSGVAPTTSGTAPRPASPRICPKRRTSSASSSAIRRSGPPSATTSMPGASRPPGSIRRSSTGDATVPAIWLGELDAGQRGTAPKPVDQSTLLYAPRPTPATGREQSTCFAMTNCNRAHVPCSGLVHGQNRIERPPTSATWQSDPRQAQLIGRRLGTI